MKLNAKIRVATSTLLFLLAIVGIQCSRPAENPIATSAIEPPTLSSASRGDVVPYAVGFPDLTVDTDKLSRSLQIVSRNLKATDCPVVEGCSIPGKRKLMRFDVATPNYGTADLIVVRPQDHPELFVYSPCHGHYHYIDFSAYRLRNASGVILTGRKQAFCLMDVSRYTQGASSQGYNCSNQGISVGWADVYDKGLDCQWLDVTDVPAGNYTLEVEINLNGVFNEGLNVYPNLVQVPVTIR